ncbi:hypothetical protein Bbelb_313200 [Branchiostoma belcheri]|nr:hypothetical protein Bbelb_313200 [Branchiostoma belcheri]
MERVQRRALRIISCFVSSRTSSTLSKGKERVCGRVPVQVDAKSRTPTPRPGAPQRATATDRILRNSQAVSAPRARTKRLQQSFLHRAIALYNKELTSGSGYRNWDEDLPGSRAASTPLATACLRPGLPYTNCNRYIETMASPAVDIRRNQLEMRARQLPRVKQLEDPAQNIQQIGPHVRKEAELGPGETDWGGTGLTWTQPSTE